MTRVVTPERVFPMVVIIYSFIFFRTIIILYAILFFFFITIYGRVHTAYSNVRVDDDRARVNRREKCGPREPCWGQKYVIHND